jgi:glycosyltransferase involved in cell wall biosynthesis
MIRIIPAIRTSHRDKPTLPGTIDSLREGGFEEPLVFAEPNSPPGDYYRVFSQQMLPFKSFVETAQTLMNDHPNEWYLICEDDVEFQTGCADFLRSLPIGKDQAFTLYISQTQSRRTRINDGFSLLEGDIHGSLAYLIHADALKKILLSSTFLKWDNTARVDKAFCLAATECKIDLVTHVPTLAQHTGLTSTLNSARKLNSGRLSNFQKTRTPLPLLTLITPTGDRHEAFRLCERWMTNQRYQGDIQWIVVDDGVVPTTPTMGQEYIRIEEPMKEHSLCRNLRAAFPHIRGQNILIIEDDDYYGPDYLSAMVGQLSKADLVGERGAKYYFIRHQKWFHYLSHTHVSLCRTGMTANVLPVLKKVITDTEHPSVDIRLWETWVGKKHNWTDEMGTSRMCVGIKGVHGRGSIGHRPRTFSNDDPGRYTLRRWTGEDYKAWDNLLPPPSEALAYSVNLNNYDVTAPLRSQRIPVVLFAEPKSAQGYSIIPTFSNSPKFDSRYYKILGCHHFQDSEWVAYFDSQLHPTKPLHEWISWMRSHGEADLYVYHHHERHCVYEEAKAVIEAGKDTTHRVTQQINRYRQEGVPEQGGLYLGGIHLRRNTPAIREFEKLWWNEVKNGSHRDQISLPVAIARSNIRVIALPPLGFTSHFQRYRHGGGRAVDDRFRTANRQAFQEYMRKPSKRKNIIVDIPPGSS